MQSNSLTHRLTNTFEGHPWYGSSVLGKLKRLDFTKVNDVPHPSVNSVAKLVQHMINWRVLAIEKMKGHDYEIEMDSEQDWPNIIIETKEGWNAQIAELHQTQIALLSLVENASNDSLQAPVPGRTYNVEYLVEGIIQHDIYHLGQIAVVSKLAGIAN